MAVVETYTYEREDGKPFMQVQRLEPKNFIQRHACPEAPGGYTYGLGGKSDKCACEPLEPVLYRLPQVKQQIAEGGAVYLVEGEKDVHTLEALGKVATCNPMGVGKWRDGYTATLEGAHLVLVPDNDTVGLEHMRTVAISLEGKLQSLRVLRLPDLPDKGDVTDWLQDHSAEDFDEAVRLAPLWNNCSGSFVSFVSEHLGGETETLDEAGWGDREPLPETTPAVPPLPPEMVPNPLRAWLVDMAVRICLPLELVVIPALVALATVLGRKIGIRPKQYDDWTVVANLWGAVIGRPGIMKSAAVSAGMTPLNRLEIAMREIFEREQPEADTRAEVLNIEIDAIKKGILAASKKGHRDEVAALTAELKTAKQSLAECELQKRRYLTQDATIERLGELLRDNPNGLMLFRDELAGWLKSLDKKGRENDREFYLEAWNGTGSYTFDRIMRGETTIPALCLSVLGSIQPSKLEHYLQGALGNGDGDDGLLQRFQLLVWPDGLPQWENIDRYPDGEAKRRAFAIYERLDKLECSDLGLDSQEASIPYLRFADDAQTLFNTWRDGLELRLRSDELSYTPAFEAHLAKYRSLMPSLALIFHLIDWCDSETTRPETPVSLDAAQLAAGWCDYLELHAKKLYAPEVLHHVRAAKALAEKIDEGHVKDGTAVREIYRKGWEGLEDKQAVLNALEVLCEANWTRVEDKTTKGRPSQVVRLHPELRAKAALEAA